MIQVAIVEDDEIFLKTIVHFIDNQKDIKCVLCNTSLGEFYETLNISNTPGIILLDQHVGAVNSIEQLDKIYKLLPDVRIVVITGFDNPKSIRKSLLMGVDGYYAKGDDPLFLLTVIREVMRGNAYLSPKATKVAVDMIRRNGAQPVHEVEQEKLVARLAWNPTPRELSVIQGLIEGKSYKEIAMSNFMTVDGVRYYVRTIYPKLGVTNRDQMVRKLVK
jgi:DNA-binding NarL/FixJ family response regulator